MSDIKKIYENRFQETRIEKRVAVWRALCKYYFSPLVPDGASVLDVACGYGEFINSIVADKKFAIDLNPDSKKYLDTGINYFNISALDMNPIVDNSIDFAFASNFLEHLHNKNECDTVMKEVYRVLVPGGKFVILGPNIKYSYKEYWDYYDHHLPLSHLSTSEGLIASGFKMEKVIDKFLPYTMRGKAPAGDVAIRVYLTFSLLWKFFGKQFLVVARKP